MHKHGRTIAAALCFCSVCLLISCSGKTEQSATQRPPGSTSSTAGTTEPDVTQPSAAQTNTTQPNETQTTEATQANTGTNSAETQESTAQSTKKTVTTTAKKVTTTAKPVTTQSQKEKDAAFAQEVLSLCNAERKKEGLAALKRGNATLQACADIRAGEAQKSFSHTRPNGKDFYNIFEEKKLTYGFCGENLAQYGAKAFTAESLVQGWMNSPSHRQNILSANFQYMSLGHSGNTYSQMFFTPM